VTGVGGTFSIPDVTPPYDLYVVGTAASGLFGSGTYPAVNVYAGLTVANPSITRLQRKTNLLPFCTTGTTCQSVSGGLTGGNATNPLMVAWSKGGSSSTADATFAFTVGGFSDAAPTQAGTLYALQYAADAGGVPQSFLYGTLATTLNRSANNLRDIPVAAVASTKTMSGTLVLPPGFVSPNISLYSQLGSAESVVRYQPITSLAINGAVPNIAAADFGSMLHVTATLDGATTSASVPLVDAANDLNITLPTPATLALPADAAPGVTTATPFSWDDDASSVSELTLTAASVLSIHVFTATEQATIPNIPGYALPANTSFSWRVTTYAGHGAVDDLAGPVEIAHTASQDFTGPKRADADSGSRTFTTAN